MTAGAGRRRADITIGGITIGVRTPDAAFLRMLEGRYAIGSGRHAPRSSLLVPLSWSWQAGHSGNRTDGRSAPLQQPLWSMQLAQPTAL